MPACWQGFATGKTEAFPSAHLIGFDVKFENGHERPDSGVSLDFHAAFRPDPALDLAAFDQGFCLDRFDAENRLRFV